MIRRVVFALIAGVMVAHDVSAQDVPANPPLPSPSLPVYASPQSPPKVESAEVPPLPPKPVQTARAAEPATASAKTANRTTDRLDPLPRRASTFRQTNPYARGELLMDRGRYANPGGVGRRPEYYTANTLASQATRQQAAAARFDRGGGPDRYQQIAAFQAGQQRARNVQDNINAYGRPYGAFGAGFGFGFGLYGGGLYGYPR